MDAFRQDHEENDFEVHEVYAIDCYVSTGDGHARELDTRTTIYKRNPEIVYQLKMKASRGRCYFYSFVLFLIFVFSAVFSEIEKKHDTMCFTLRMLEDEKKSKMGIVECVKHGLCTQYPVVFEKEGRYQL